MDEPAPEHAIAEESSGVADRGVQRWLPRWVAWPLAGAAVSYAAAFRSNRMLWRRFIHDASLKALQLNKLVYPELAQTLLNSFHVDRTNRI